jgi:1,4-dihydroxy-2-naphthoate octaprenyltransferase
MAYRDGCFHPLSAFLCLLVAVFAQVASNFANDYFDFKNGADTAERLGPERAVAQGWIAPKDMLVGTFAALGLACVAGLWLVSISDWRLILVGIAIAFCVLAYSAGPFPLAYNGLGDVCVLIFYGVIPVCFTYYVQAFSIPLLVKLMSVAIGLLGVNILVVNNYRDYAQDKAARKRTSIVLLGRGFGKVLYIFNQVVALALVFPFLRVCGMLSLALFCLWFVMSVFTTKQLFILEGRSLNRTLGETARNLFVYAIALSSCFLTL